MNNPASRFAISLIVFLMSFFVEAKTIHAGAADIVFIMDNTGSMQYGDPYFCSTAGDPTFYRDDIVKKGMQRERDTASVAVAGFISFNGSGTSGIETSRLQPLLNISKSTDPTGLANLNTLQTKVVADSGFPLANPCDRTASNNTEWYPSFSIAIGWFNDTTLSKTHNKAIVLISDGAANDYIAKILPLANGGKLPPVYGIHLGDSLDVTGNPSNAYQNMRDLSSLTRGRFFRISPRDTVSMRMAMDTVVLKILGGTTAIFPRILMKPRGGIEIQKWNDVRGRTYFQHNSVLPAGIFPEYFPSKQVAQ